VHHELAAHLAMATDQTRRLCARAHDFHIDRSASVRPSNFSVAENAKKSDD
jgi:hypothetical protein